MSKTQKIIISELENKRRSKLNKTFLGIFLGFCLVVLLSRIIMGVLIDMGLHDGHFHIGYWSDVENDYSFKPQYLAWKNTHSYLPDTSFKAFLACHPSISAMINHHPFTFWWLTQFTWLTTLIVIFFLTFRFFGLNERIPKWLKWIASQNTIAHVATWDLIVACFFWAGLASNFASAFNASLFVPEYITTVCVHGIIPLLMIVYATIYLVKDKRASRLKEFFALKGLIFPGIYSCLYLVLTIVWYDPYNVTSMNDNLVDGGWAKWATQLWISPTALITIYVFLGITTVIHNFLLVKYNKHYRPNHDYEAGIRREVKLEKIRRKIIVKEINKKIK